MLKKAAIAALCLTILIGFAESASAVSNAGVLFLRIAAGARAAGMGESFVAMADDATSTHWNPAGLGQYPLYGKWLELPPPQGLNIQQAVLVQSVKLGEGDATYDVWAIAEGKLVKLSGDEWETEVSLPEGVNEVYTIASSGGNLWLATDRGLYQSTVLLDKWSWKPLVAPTEDGWAVEMINDIYITAGPRIWLATDDGVKVYDGIQWTRYGTEHGLPTPKILQVYFVNSQFGWVVTAAGLARFDSGVFYDAEDVSALIGDKLPELTARFLGTEDNIRIARAVEEIREYNHLDSDDLAAGMNVRFPYRLAVESEITCLTSDITGRLWVGTEQGLKVYEQKRWKSFGYRTFTTTEPVTLAAIAESYLGVRATPNRIDAFARWTARYNDLPLDEPIPVGRTVYLYSNPTGGPVRSLMNYDQKLYVGSKYGFMVYDAGQWSRMYHSGLDRADGVAMAHAGRDLWFFAPDKIVTYARAHSEVTLMHVNWLPSLAEDIYYEYFSFVSHMEGWGTIGANITILSYGEVARTPASGPEIIGSFNPFDFSFGMSYGTRLNENLAAGLTAKVIYSRLSEQGAGQEKGSGTATAFGIDAGLLYNTPLSRLTLGVALTNLGPDITYIDADQSDPLPRNLAVGFSYRLLDSPFNRMTITAEINKDLVDWGDDASTELKQIIYNAGFEYWYAKLVALRAGYIYDEDGDIKTPTVGGGLSWKGLGIDLAYIPSVREDQVMANILRVSLTGRF